MPSTVTFLPHPSSGLLRIVKGAVRQVAAAIRAVKNRREVMHLLELDDRALKDIGLVRNDVAGVLEAPLTSDPSVILRLRAVERRARARQVPASARRMTPVADPDRCNA